MAVNRIFINTQCRDASLRKLRLVSTYGTLFQNSFRPDTGMMQRKTLCPAAADSGHISIKREKQPVKKETHISILAKERYVGFIDLKNRTGAQFDFLLLKNCSFHITCR